jgi:hypothetical protein
MRGTLAWCVLAVACGRPTHGEVCVDFGDAFCRGFLDCHSDGGSYSECFDAYMEGCCQDNNSCGEDFDRDGVNLRSCADDIDACACVSESSDEYAFCIGASSCTD